MTVLGRRVEEAYSASYPPSVLNPARGATAGIPGTWTPAGSVPPATPADLMAGRPVVVTASPATPWTTGQFVQTTLAGAAGRATWTGTGWVGGVAALDATGDSAGPSPRRARSTVQEAP